SRPDLRLGSVFARSRARTRANALFGRSPSCRRRSRRRPCSAQGHELGPPSCWRIPRLLPRLSRPFRGDPARAHPGTPLAGRGSQDRPCYRARHSRGSRTRRDVTRAQSAPGADSTGTNSPSEGPIQWGLLPDSSAVGSDGRLSVGGVDLVELADELGTPLFVYDEDQIRARCREAVAGFGPGVAYATKAFLCKAMAALAVEENMFLDVSTGGELAVA